MKIVISSQGENLDAPTSAVFGRCPSFVFVDTETLAFEALSNPAVSQGGGAGVQAAQFVLNEGAQAVLTGNLGPKAFDGLVAAEVQGYLVPEGTVRQASVGAHAGLGGSRRMGRSAPPQPKPEPAKEAELEALRETLKTLRQQLAETMTKIEDMEQEA
jgi:predicted Fe-Mo cluster-binding NifX family protein